MTHPTEGSIAPDFTLDTDAGTPLSLSALRGRPVVLFFYPKDDTPGCTKEACAFRDAWDEYTAASVGVVGVSSDDDASHRKFAEKYGFVFPLVAAYLLDM